MNVDAITNLLASLKENNRDVEQLLLITDDGFPIISTLETGDEEVRSTAVGAILCDSGQRGIRELELGALEAVITLGTEGYFVLTRLREDTLFMVVALPEASLGLILLRIKQARPALLKALEEH